MCNILQNFLDSELGKPPVSLLVHFVDLLVDLMISIAHLSIQFVSFSCSFQQKKLNNKLASPLGLAKPAVRNPGSTIGQCDVL